MSRWRGPGWLVGGAGVAAAAAVLLIIFAAWAGGALDTSGDEIDWQAVEALAAVATVVAALFAVGALGFAARELENRAVELQRQAEADRVSRSPYLRVDVSLLETTQPGFTPPPVTHLLGAEAVGVGSDLLTAIQPRPAPNDDKFTLVVWVRNLQSAPLGIAFNVHVELIIGWTDGERFETAVAELSFPYLGPEAVSAVAVTEIDPKVSGLVAEIVDVTYEDMFHGPALSDVHGAMRMSYDVETGLRNERKGHFTRDTQAAGGAEGAPV